MRKRLHKFLLLYMSLTMIFSTFPLDLFGSSGSTQAATNTNNEGIVGSGRYLEFNIANSSGTTISGLSSTETTKDIYLKGKYEAASIVGKSIQFKYTVRSKGVYENIQSGNIFSPFTVNTSNDTGTFNKKLTVKRGQTSCSVDEICIPEADSDYTIAVWMEYTINDDGNTKTQIFSQVYQTLTINSSNVLSYVETTDNRTIEISDRTGGYEFGLYEAGTNNLIQDNHKYSISELKSNPLYFDIYGYYELKDSIGKEVQVYYDILDYHSYLNDAKNEGLIKRYTQTETTETGWTTFNRKFGMKIGTGETESSVDYNILLEEERSYVIRIAVEIDGEIFRLRDYPIHVFHDKTKAIDGEVNPEFHEPVPSTSSEERLDFQLTRGTNSFQSVSLSELNSQNIAIDVLGNYKGDTTLNDRVTIKYQLASIDSPYVEQHEGLLKSYTQSNSVFEQQLEFNRKLYITSETNPTPRTEGPVIKLKSYPAKYTFKVQVTFGKGTDEKIYQEKVIEFDVTGTQENYFNVDGDVPTFQTLTNLEVQLREQTSTGLVEIFDSNTDENGDLISKIDAVDIKTTPMHLNIQGLFTHKIDNNFDDVLIKFEVTSFESYSENNQVNDVIKRYIETNETEGRGVEFNRDIWISTKSREDKTQDNLDSTIYLDDDTRYYTIRISAFNKSTGNSIILRDAQILVNGVGTSYDPLEGPNLTLPDGLSSYFLDANGNLTQNLEITARKLNESQSVGGINIDLRGFIKSSWGLQDKVKINYELIALNSYKDYIKNSSGIEETLDLDYDNEVYQSDPTEYTQTTLVSPMEEFLKTKTTSQTGYLKTYSVTEYTKNNHEGFMRKFNLRTRLEQDLTEVQNDSSVLFLDNVARSYRLTVTADNLNDSTSNGVVTKTIDLKIVTVPESANNQPEVAGTISVQSPQKGTGWFIDETMNISWTPASDLDNELLYYKIYYYYTTTDETGMVNDEIRQWIGRYDDMPVNGGTLNYPYVVDTPAKIEPAYIRILACDVNHVCSESTRSNPFKFNEFGVQGGGTSTAISANVSIYPKPDGLWKNHDIEVSVMFEGDADLLVGAVKRYEVTNSAQFPGLLTKSIPGDSTILLQNNGKNYVHVQYELSNGSKVSATAGPYKIDKTEVSGFNVTLEDANGSLVNEENWTNQNLMLNITSPTSTNHSNVYRQYKIDGFHSDWLPYTDKIEISLEGNYRIFGRAVNDAGTFSEQKYVVAKIDKTKPTFDAMYLTETMDENNVAKYEVTALVAEGESGVDYVELADQTKLNMNGNSFTHTITDIANKPLAVRAYDKAGNVSDDVNFLDVPSITYANEYSTTTEVVKDDVVATINGTGILSYQFGNRLYGCSLTPCDVSIDKNTQFTAINRSGIKTSKKVEKIDNIDKSPTRLILNGERSSTSVNEITFEWNYDIANAEITCENAAGTEAITPTGTSTMFTYSQAENYTYACSINGDIYNENVTSNTITIYPDYNKEVTQPTSGNITEKELDKNIFIEESRLGTSYYINIRKDNAESKFVPLPDDLFLP